MIRKYLVDKLTISTFLRISISFASRHGFETLSLHESSLELSVEETHTHNASEEKIKHCVKDMSNHSTPTECPKIKHAENLHIGFTARDTSPITFNRHDGNLNPIHALSDDITFNYTSFLKDHLLNSSTSYTVYANVADSKNILMLLLSNFMENNVLYGEGIEWTDLGYSQYQNPKIFNFIMYSREIFYPGFENGQKTIDINSSYATKNNEYGLVEDLQMQSNDLAMNLGTVFADNVLVHDGSVANDTSLGAGILKGQDLLTFMPKNMHANVRKISAHNHISDLIICKHASFCVKRTDDSGRRLNHVNSGHMIFLFNHWHFKDLLENGFAGTFNAFYMTCDASSADEFALNIFKLEQKASAIYMDANPNIPLANNGGALSYHDSIFERSIVGSEEHTGG